MPKTSLIRGHCSVFSWVITRNIKATSVSFQQLEECSSAIMLSLMNRPSPSTPDINIFYLYLEHLFSQLGNKDFRKTLPQLLQIHLQTLLWFLLSLFHALHSQRPLNIQQPLLVITVTMIKTSHHSLLNIEVHHLLQSLLQLSQLLQRMGVLSVRQA